MSIAIVAIAAMVGSTQTASAATLTFVRDIQTRPFVGTSTSMNDNEGIAYVPSDNMLWVIDDSRDRLHGVNRTTGVLGQTFIQTQFDNAHRFGSSELAGSDRTEDLEAVAYDAATDTLYAFSGNCCTSAAKPTVFRLMRSGGHGPFHIDSWQPLNSPYNDLSGAEVRNGVLWAAHGTTLVAYDFVSNTTTTPQVISGASTIYGVGFSPDGAEMWLAMKGNVVRKYNWATKAAVSGASFSMSSLGVKDARAVSQVGNELYICDGYDHYGSTTSAFAVRVYSLGSGSGAVVPVASFTPTSATGQAPLAVTFTDTSTNTPTTWNWNFGDGNSSTLRNPSHTYTTPGTYSVRLTASNAAGSNASAAVTVAVTGPPPPRAPVASFTSTATSGTAPLTVTFTDTSTNTPASWIWNFGDGTTSTMRNPTKTYTTPGRYSVVLTATNAAGGDPSDPTAIVVNPPPSPVASFTSTATTGIAPHAVAFTDTSTNSPTSWSWNFGDGATSTLQNPSYIYAAPGVYGVTLTATNAGGSSTSVVVQITVDPQPPQAPVASGRVTPASGTAPLTVSFTDASVNAPTSWLWDFGDGARSTDQNPSHTFVDPGTYEVVLTATNAQGSDSSDPIVVQVSSPGAGRFVFAPSDDAYIDSSVPSTPKGTSSMVYNVATASKNQRSFFRFRVSGVTGTVVSAKLRLWLTDGTDNGARWYRIPESGWTEGSLTWSTAPPVSGVLVANPGALTSDPAWVEIDVSLVVNGDGTYSFATLPESVNAEKYSTKESANRPELVIVTS